MPGMRSLWQLSGQILRKQKPSVVSDYSYFVNDLAKGRKPSPLRELMKMLATASSDIIFLAEGLPHGDTHPFNEARFSLKDGSHITLSGKTLTSALQYGPTEGYPQLLQRLREFQERFHNPPGLDDRDIIATVGAQDGLCKMIELCMDFGDPVVVPAPTYSGVLAMLRPYRPEFLSVKEDKYGMCPYKLRDELNRYWSISHNSMLKPPKFLYLNPTASNPSGTVMPIERKKEIYEVASDFNLLILEDDPYYFLHFDDKEPQSFLSIDTEGRVIRFDSFSKVFSSGLRLGFITGPRPLMQVVEYHMQASVLHTSSLSQVIALKLLDQLGWDGFIKYMENIREFYMKRRNFMSEVAKKHLQGKAEWTMPDGGMFLWIKVNGVPDVYDMVMKRGVHGKGVMFVPGHAFMPDPTLPCPYIRASYSLAPLEDMDQGFARLAELITEEKKLHLK
ncbi:kynurenine/alpha-aminoadipate aminotransferase, mitochondrial-like [Hetaerina americana]|uniref:kynurenine/alpha-aminoadipate aminotransferase, mitochondrial-like n=1 Tax=Hetaerina americana TaxID=62018 RepID=UPI003A7F363B